jgi:hypothetical protein
MENKAKGEGVYEPAQEWSRWLHQRELSLERAVEMNKKVLSQRTVNRILTLFSRGCQCPKIALRTL